MTDQIFLESSLRSLLIALLAVGFGFYISKTLNKRANSLIWIIGPLFLCFFIPPIAVAYGYSNISSKLVQQPVLHQSLYVLIMICRLTAPVTILLLFIPKQLSPEGFHCYNLSRSLSSRSSGIASHLLFLIKGSTWRYLVAFILVYMLAFSEFELASLMNIHQWSVSLFDSYSQGISPLSALRLHFLPFLFQFILLVVFLSMIPSMTGCELPKEIKDIQHSGNLSSLLKTGGIPVSILTCLFFFVGVLYPSFVIIKSAIPGFSILFKEFWMLKELVSSLLFAFAASLLSYIIASLLPFLTQKGRLKIILFIVLIPVLIGMLPLSLLVFSLFQLPFFSPLSDAPLPLLVTLTMWSLPFVVILQVIINSFSADESTHSARLLLPFSKSKATELLWGFKFKAGFWIFFFVFTLTYFDLTASAILAPASMTTITARFYNLMHYGESEKLSATLCVSIIVPILLFSFIGLALKVLIRRWNALSKSG